MAGAERYRDLQGADVSMFFRNAWLLAVPSHRSVYANCFWIDPTYSWPMQPVLRVMQTA